MCIFKFNQQNDYIKTSELAYGCRDCSRKKARLAVINFSRPMIYKRMYTLYQLNRAFPRHPICLLKHLHDYIYFPTLHYIRLLYSSSLHSFPPGLSLGNGLNFTLRPTPFSNYPLTLHHPSFLTRRD